MQQVGNIREGARLRIYVAGEHISSYTSLTPHSEDQFTTYTNRPRSWTGKMTTIMSHILHLRAGGDTEMKIEIK